MAEAAKKRRYARKKPTDDVGNVVVPERFAHIVGDLAGIPLLKALHFLNEGERIGREGGSLAEQLVELRRGVVALLEAQANKGTDTSVVAFRPKVTRAPGDDSALPGGLTAKDLARVQEYCKEISGGDQRLANLAYARVMEDAKASGKLNSRWEMLAGDAIQKANGGGVAQGDMDLFEEWDDGTGDEPGSE